jgi:polyferredoxin
MKTVLFFVFTLTFLLFNCSSFGGVNDSTQKQTDEFLNVDSFNEFKNESATIVAPVTSTTLHDDNKDKAGNYYWTLGILLFTIIAGLLVRVKNAGSYRSLFLLLSVGLLGFYRGSCPCSISSLQGTAFAIMGLGVKWHSILLFLGLVPITYFFGRVYCGWICQLGALQEFIFTSSHFRLLQSYRAQQILRKVRMIVLAALVIQLIITQTNLYKYIDPFVAIYNFYSSSATAWILAGILILSSVFMFRPFCKTICPVGLVLGWVSKIPGASILAPNEKCISCANCSNKCKIRATTYEAGKSTIQNEECIRCGECIIGCKRDALSFYWNGKKHHSESTSSPFLKHPPSIK